MGAQTLSKQLNLLELFRGRRVLLLLIVQAAVDDLAELAGVLAVEGLAQGLGESAFLRVAHDHACPCSCLKQCPVPTDGQQKGKNDQIMDTTAQHEDPIPMEARSLWQSYFSDHTAPMHQHGRVSSQEPLAVCAGALVTKSVDQF